jgi:hypothetical protein
MQRGLIVAITKIEFVRFFFFFFAMCLFVNLAYY